MLRSLVGSEMCIRDRLTEMVLNCGSPMTTATGKSGRYRYYKCTSKINSVGKKECQNTNVRMETLDRLVLQAVAEKVFTPWRVERMMAKVSFDLKESQPNYDEQIRRLSREMELSLIHISEPTRLLSISYAVFCLKKKKKKKSNNIHQIDNRGRNTQ